MYARVAQELALIVPGEYTPHLPRTLRLETYRGRPQLPWSD